MSVFNYFQEYFQVFILIFSRVFGLLLVIPVFSSGVPARARAGLSFFCALFSVPMIVGLNVLSPSPNMAIFGVTILSSFLIGLAIGFIVQVTVSAVQLSSTIFSTTLGLSFSENIDPVSNESIPVLGNFLSVITMLLFIRTDFHITFIETIIMSFKDIPIANALTSESLLVALKTSTSILFFLALKIALPIIGITLLLDVAMGLIGRVAPQFNVMIMGWNMKIFIGLVMLWLIIPGIIDIVTTIFDDLYTSIMMFLKSAKGA